MTNAYLFLWILYENRLVDDKNPLPNTLPTWKCVLQRICLLSFKFHNAISPDCVLHYTIWFIIKYPEKTTVQSLFTERQLIGLVWPLRIYTGFGGLLEIINKNKQKKDVSLYSIERYKTI